MLRFFVRLCSVEILLWAFGLMVLPRPSVIVAMVAFAAFALIFERLSRDDGMALVEDRLSEWVQRLQSTPRTIALWIAFLVTASLFAPATPFLEGLLWSTGTFGEPPGNRFMRIRPMSDRAAMVEFAVKTSSTGPFSVSVKLTEEPTEIFGWIGNACQTKPNRSAYGLGKLDIQPLRTESLGYGGYSESRSISPATSAYIYVESGKPFDISDCWFLSLGHPGDKRDVFCNNGGVEVVIGQEGCD